MCGPSADAGTVLHYTGGAWTTVTRADAKRSRSLGNQCDGHLDRRRVRRASIQRLHVDGRSKRNVTIEGIWGTGPTNLWAVGGTAIYVWNGTAWANAIQLSSVEALVDIWGTSPTDVWAVGYNTIMHFDGATWSHVAQDFPGTDYPAVWGSSESNIWVGGSARLLHLDHALPHLDGGNCVAPVPITCGATLNGAITASLANRFTSYAACPSSRADSGGEIYYRLDTPVRVASP